MTSHMILNARELSDREESSQDEMSGKRLKLESAEDDIQTVQVCCQSRSLCPLVGSLH